MDLLLNLYNGRTSSRVASTQPKSRTDSPKIANNQNFEQMGVSEKGSCFLQGSCLDIPLSLTRGQTHMIIDGHILIRFGSTTLYVDYFLRRGKGPFAKPPFLSLRLSHRNGSGSGKGCCLGLAKRGYPSAVSLLFF